MSHIRIQFILFFIEKINSQLMCQITFNQKMNKKNVMFFIQLFDQINV